MKVKANEELFNRWRELGLRVQALGGIVQNDMELDPTDFQIWTVLALTVERDLRKCIADTMWLRT